jgi:hypothetical protein
MYQHQIVPNQVNNIVVYTNYEKVDLKTKTDTYKLILLLNSLRQPIGSGFPFVFSS